MPSETGTGESAGDLQDTGGMSETEFPELVHHAQCK